MKKKILLILVLVVLGGVGAYLYINMDKVAEAEGEVLELTESVKITKAGTYYLSGNIEDGSVTVDSNGEVTLVLQGININNSSGPAIYIENASDINIVLDEGYESTLTDNGTSENDGVIYSKEDLYISGSGSLIINANNQDGIVSKDNLTISSGNITINSIDDGIRGKDSVTIDGGTFVINSGGDGIKSSNEEDDLGNIIINDGTFTIDADLDGIQALGTLTINGGSFDITTGDGSSLTSSDSLWGELNGTTESIKGLKASSDIIITSGSFTLDTEDDAIHSNASITISGGSYTISSGDDGVHADDTLTISSGSFSITESYEGLEASSITIDGGEFSITSSDDGINVAGGADSSSMDRPGANNFSSNSDYVLTINDGTLYVDASGDGLDSNGNIYINGGTIYVDGPTSGDDTALDFDGSCEVNGGVLVAVGSSNMLEVPSSSSSQNIAVISLSSSMSGEIEIGDISYTPSKSYQLIIVSSSSLKTNTSYTVKIDGSTYTTFTQSSTVTTVGSSSNGMLDNRNGNNFMR